MRKNRLIILSSIILASSSLVGCGETSQTIDDATNAVTNSTIKLQEVSSSYYDAGFLGQKSVTKFWSYEISNNVELTDDNAYFITAITNIDSNKVEKVKTDNLTSLDGAIESYVSFAHGDNLSEFHYKDGHSFITIGDALKLDVSTELDSYFASALTSDITAQTTFLNLLLDNIQNYCASLDEKAEDDPNAASISLFGYTFTPYYERTFKVIRTMLLTETSYYDSVINWFNGKITSEQLLNLTVNILNNYLPQIIKAMLPESIYKVYEANSNGNINVENMLLNSYDQSLLITILDSVQTVTKNSIEFSINEKEIAFSIDSESVEKVYNAFYDSLSDNYSSLLDSDALYSTSFITIYKSVLNYLAENSINEVSTSFSNANLKFLLEDGVLSGFKGSANYVDPETKNNMAFVFETSIELSGTKYSIDKTYDDSYISLTQEEFVNLINGMIDSYLSSMSASSSGK